MTEDVINFTAVLTSWYAVCTAHHQLDCPDATCAAIAEKRAEWWHRLEHLRVRKGMTPRAARIVLDAAMYGIGCTEGKIREEIERKKQEKQCPTLPQHDA
jgi:hypothetical protein